MRRFLTIAGLLLAMWALLTAGSYLSLVRARSKVDGCWNQFRRISQRQIDLIPQGSAWMHQAFPRYQRPLKFLEKSHRDLLQRQLTLRHPAISQNELRAFEGAYEETTKAVERILKTLPNRDLFEKTPHFQEWGGSYEGTRRLLQIEKERYNAAASSYNRLIRRFFVRWVAEKFKFQRRALFRGGEGLEG